MKKTFTLLFSLFLFTVQGFCSTENFIPAGCSVAGTASLAADSICFEDSTTLMLAGYSGSIQWQSFDGTNWINESGTGSTTDNYTLLPGQTMQYRALVTNGVCPVDSSNIVTVTVGVIPAPAGTGATRCGIGQVTLTGTGNGTLNWYTTPTGGAPIGSGPSVNTYVTSSTTFYLESASGGGNAQPLQTTFAGGNGFNGNMFDIIAINQVTIASFDGNLDPAAGTVEIWYRAGSFVGFELSNAGWTQVGSAALTTTNGAGIPTPIPIPINVTIPAGQTYAFYVHYSGAVTYSNGTAVGNIFVQDANIQVLEGAGGDYFQQTFTPRVWNGIIHYTSGCSSPRVPVAVTVTPPAGVTINPPTAALCQGNSVSLTASSSNVNYAYAWSPATGLSSTTGATVTATPGVPTTYVVIGDDGTCASSDTIFVDVGPQSAAGAATNTVDTICLGNTVTLNLTGSVGNIQWQSNTGSGWVNETGPGFNSSVYIATPAANTQYIAVVTSGGCPSDTSVILSITVLTVSDPVVNDTTVCAPDSVSFFAGGQGTMAWYNSPTGGPDLYLGNPYTAYITGTTTLYVEARAGGTFHVGPADNLIGNVNQNGVAGNGLYFDVTRLCTLDKIYVFPSQTGMAKFSIYDPGGAIVFTDSAFVTAFTGKTAIAIGFDLQPGTNYRLVMESGSVPLFYNYQNGLASYTIGTCPVTINNFSSPNYYFFYDWVVFEGCKSNRVPLNVTAIPAPAVPIINQNGSTLTSSSSINNQWYFNGNIIPGAVNQTLSISQTGLYTVVVTGSNGCTSSGSLNVTTIGLDEFASAGISVYPNPVSEKINVELTGANSHLLQIRLMQVNGSLVMDEKMEKNISMFIIDTRKLAGGSYLLEISTESGVFRKMMLKE